MLHLLLYYIDPGSGSYLVQVLIAAFLGLVFYFKTGVLWVKSIFKGRKREDKDKHSAS